MSTSTYCPPYFALTDVELHGDGSITARAPIEQPLGAELGPVSGAEAGRHLAICGSIAAAWANPKQARFHYLATDAELRRAKGKVPTDATSLVLHATATMIDKRTAHAMVVARTEAAAPVCSLSCCAASTKALATAWNGCISKRSPAETRESAPCISNSNQPLLPEQPPRTGRVFGHGRHQCEADHRSAGRRPTS